MSETDEISTSGEAASAFKNTVNQLMTGIGPIVQRIDKGNGKMPDVSTLLAGATSGNGLSDLFEKNLSPSQKLLLAQAWAKAMDAEIIIRRFIKSTKSRWTAFQDGNEKVQEAALLEIIDGLDMPRGGAQFLKQLYDKKSVLTEKERTSLMEYFKAFIDYAMMYEELKKEEGHR
jgi:hypothetical protein